MATKKSDVDAWTSNGKGVRLIGQPTAAQKAAVDKINKDLAKKSAGTKKKK